jgi:hypothetical protein
MKAQAYDVVVVPDFSEPVARRFEIMTLLFLASWQEFGGRTREMPLHLVCIGEPPDSVRALGDRCGAHITVHEPLLVGAFANKLRGFEIAGQTDHVLLIDSDMLVMSDIYDLLADLGSDCVAASTSIGRCRVREDRWRRIHQAMEIPFPEHQVIPLNLELDTFQCEIYRDSDYFPPYYNGGMVFAPWASGMGDMWRDHFQRIFEIDPDIKGPDRKVSNQPSLATAITQMQRQGIEFRLIPDEYHVRWQHIAAGAVTCQQTKLLHAVGFGRWSSKTNDNTAAEEIDIYLANTLRLTRQLRSHRGPLTRLGHFLSRRPRLRECYRVHGRMKHLYEKYVRELMDMNTG